MEKYTEHFLRSAVKNYQELPIKKDFSCKLPQAVFCGVRRNCEEDICMTQVVVY